MPSALRFWAYTIDPHFVAKIIYIYLFRGLLFSFISISTKYLNKIFLDSVNEEVYLEEYHSLDYYFSRLSLLFLSDRQVQARHYNFKEKRKMYYIGLMPSGDPALFQDYQCHTFRYAVDDDMVISLAIFTTTSYVMS